MVHNNVSSVVPLFLLYHYKNIRDLKKGSSASILFSLSILHQVFFWPPNSTFTLTSILYANVCLLSWTNLNIVKTVPFCQSRFTECRYGIIIYVKSSKFVMTSKIAQTIQCLFVTLQLKKYETRLKSKGQPTCYRRRSDRDPSETTYFPVEQQIWVSGFNIELDSATV